MAPEFPALGKCFYEAMAGATIFGMPVRHTLRA